MQSIYHMIVMGAFCVDAYAALVSYLDFLHFIGEKWTRDGRNARMCVERSDENAEEKEK